MVIQNKKQQRCEACMCAACMTSRRARACAQGRGGLQRRLGSSFAADRGVAAQRDMLQLSRLWPPTQLLMKTARA